MKWEFKVLDWIYEKRTPFLDKTMLFFTKIGNVGFIWHFISIILLFHSDTRLCGFCTFFSAFLASGFANLIVKPLTKRIRPCEIKPEKGSLVKKEPHGTSFPSGHTTTSFGGAVGGMVGMIWSFGGFTAIWFSVTVFILAFFISFSRMYLYVHFPTDVIVGAIIGCIFGVLTPFPVRAVYNFCLTL